MSSTYYSNSLASEIIKSWSRNRSNYIVVAPPLSNARSLFASLVDVDFIRSVAGGQHVALSIARLDTSDFKDNLTFARKVLAGWGFHKNQFAHEQDAVSLLNLAVAELRKQDKRAVLLVHRFHEALEKLGEEIGTALRNLEHDYGLRTVVELPISLTCLRERWDAIDRERPPFLASDWGQGHTVKFLKGYTVDEIEKAIAGPVDKRDIAKEVFRLTGGLNDLVEALLEPAGTLNVRSLTAYANARASSLCSRLVGWLDKPGDYVFRRIIAQSSSRPLSASEMSLLSNHDWSSVLVSKDGNLGCAMMTHVCIETLAREDLSSFVEDLKALFRSGNYDRVAELLPKALANVEPNYKLEAAMLLCEFAAATDAYADDWHPVRNVLNKFEALSNISELECVQLSWASLTPWRTLAEFMCDFAYHKKKEPALRLEQFGVEGSDVAYAKCILQLHILRLQYARRLRPYLALKSVVEQPESLLQLYIYINFGIKFWKYQGMSDADAQAISVLVRKPFRAPAKNGRLGFIEMLYIVFWKAGDLPEERKLFSNHSELLEIETLYEQRKEQVHSTGIVSSNDWAIYENFCEKWLKVVAAAEKLGDVVPLRSCEDVFFTALHA